MRISIARVIQVQQRATLSFDTPLVNSTDGDTPTSGTDCTVTFTPPNTATSQALIFVRVKSNMTQSGVQTGYSFILDGVTKATTTSAGVDGTAGYWLVVFSVASLTAASHTLIYRLAGSTWAAGNTGTITAYVVTAATAPVTGQTRAGGSLTTYNDKINFAATTFNLPSISSIATYFQPTTTIKSDANIQSSTFNYRVDDQAGNTLVASTAISSSVATSSIITGLLAQPTSISYVLVSFTTLGSAGVASLYISQEVSAP